MHEVCEGENCEETTDEETCCDCGYEEYPRELVHEAKKELLLDKLKDRLDKRYGKKLDKIADLLMDIFSEKLKKYDQIDEKEAQLEEAFEDLYSEG